MTAGPGSRAVRVLVAAGFLAGLVLGSLAWDEALAQAPWSEDFDSYASGSQMHGQGGWSGWDNNPAAGALVSNTFQRSNPNSVAITGPTDLVHEYSGYTSGRAVYTAWQYIPSGFTGTTYFIMMNQYNVAPGAKGWAVQVHFEATGRVVSDFDGNWLPIILGRWVQIRVEINLDTDTQTFYYDNTPLYANKPWICGLTCGLRSIAAVDLYANGASPVYYDDLSLDHATPALSLAKTIASGAPYSAVGASIDYSYLLTNTGNVTLFAPYNVVDDAASATCPVGPASLAPGGTVTCTGSHTVTQADINAGSLTNIATATAKDAASGGSDVTSNSSSQTATADQNPALTLTKSIVSGDPYSTVGGTIDYNYAVLNSGNLSLAGPVSVSDSLAVVSCPNVNTVGNLDTWLDPGESVTCTASYSVSQADLDAGSVTNTATASAGGTSSPPDSTTASALQSPALAIDKTALPVTYNSVGQVISYSYVVSNSGNVTLNAPFAVADDHATDEACPATATLAPAASITCTASYSITQADLDAGLVTNSATSTNGPVTSLSDSATVTAIQTTALTLTKAITSGSPYSAVGDLIEYGYDVRNTGTVTLTGPFTVLDDRSTDEACPATPSLVPGASITCTASYTVASPDLAAGSITNSAYAGGSFAGNPVTSNADQATAVAVSDPAVTKTVDPTTAQMGDTVTYTLIVGNNGPGPADNVTLADPVPAFLNISTVSVVPAGPTVSTAGNTVTVTFGTIAPGNTFTVTITTVVNSLGAPPGGTNTATVTTTSNDADPANSTSSVSVGIIVVSRLAAPATGFTPDRSSPLPAQPENLRYLTYGDLWLEIPSLGVKMSIVGVPLTEEGWDVTWLGSRAGYLAGTAFPTRVGNSVITGHVTLPSGRTGPFSLLSLLHWDDSIIIHYGGQRYVYSVRGTASVSPTDPQILRHEDRAWLTLVTCQDFDPLRGEYRRRYLVKAVLVRIE